MFYNVGVWKIIHDYTLWNKTCAIMVSWWHQCFVYVLQWNGTFVPTHQIMCMALWGGTVTMACSKTHYAQYKAGTHMLVWSFVEN